MVVTTLPFAAPLAYIVVRAFGDGAFFSTLGDAQTLGPLGRSLLLALAVASAASAVGAAAAWLVARTDLPGRRALAVLLALPLVIPSFIGAFTFVAAFSPGGLIQDATGIPGRPVSGFWGAFAVLTALTYPYVYLPAAARFRQVPAALEESARMLGHGALSTFRHAVVPIAAPAVVAGGLLVFLYVISDFGAVALLRYDTLTLSVFSNRLLDPNLSLTLALLLAVVALSAVAAERGVAGRSRIDARRDVRPRRIALGRWRAPAIAFVAALITFTLVAPLAVLTYWATRGVAAGSSRPGSFVAEPLTLVGPTLSTSLVSVTAAAAAVVVVLPLAVYATRRGGRLAGVGNGVVLSGFALPGLVLALALVFFTLNADFLTGLYQTLPLLVGAYVLHFGGLALGTARLAVASVPQPLSDAARALGTRRTARFLRIELPLMAPGLLAGAGLVLLSAMKELPATLLLAPPGFSTLATKIWGAAEDAFWADASLASLVLVAASSVLTWLLVIRRRDTLA